MTDERDDEDNVIPFPTRMKRAVVKHDAHGTQLPQVGEIDRDECAHVQTVISRPHDKVRRFTCKACLAELDPYIWIWEFARADRNAYYNINSLKGQAKILEDRVEALKRELASLTGKVKRRRPTGGTPLSDSQLLALYHLAKGRPGYGGLRSRSERGGYASKTAPSLFKLGLIDGDGKITEAGRAAFVAEAERRKGGDHGG